MTDIEITDQEFLDIVGRKFKILRRVERRDPRSREAISREMRKKNDPAYAEKLRQRDKETNARRGDRAEEYRRRSANRSRSMSGLGAKFVAIDSEGRNVGAPFDAAGIVASIDAGSPILAAMKKAKTFQDQRAVLWGASDGEKIDWLHHEDERPLKGLEICEWLTSLPEKYGQNSIFISFGFSYDATQILRDMPFEKAKEVLGRKASSPSDEAIGNALLSNKAIKVGCDEIAMGDEECDEASDMDMETDCKSQANEFRKIGNAQLPAKSSAAYTYILWGNYVINYMKGKKLYVAKLRDRNNPFKLVTYKDGRPKLNENGTQKREFDTVAKIFIYDVFGFFQSSFVEAVEGIPGVATAEEMTFLKSMKAKRDDLQQEALATIKTYTALENRLLCRAMDRLRGALVAKGLNLRQWFGAGSIAAAMMKKYNVFEHWPDDIRCESITEWQKWAHHAFFGGHIELIQMGATTEPLYGYDVSSAYPAIVRDLPSMRKGRWIKRKLPEGQSMVDPLSVRTAPNEASKKAIAQVRQMNILSMVHVRWSDGADHIPFFPLPFRTSKGVILFPADGEGYCMLDEVLAALEFVEVNNATGLYFELIDAFEFIPSNDEKPFDFVQEIFNERARIVDETKRKVKEWKKTYGEPYAGPRPPDTEEDALKKWEAQVEKLAEIHGGPKPYDIMEKVLKLGMNSIYGKLAQSVGKSARGKVPSTANPFYAAHVTAATRAQIMRAVMRNINDIVMLATDGVVSKSKLPVECPPVKTLGKWESAIHSNGGIFAQSGIYLLDDKTKSRGIRASFVNAEGDLKKWFQEEIIPRWKKGEAEYEFKYKSYLTIGAATASEKTYLCAGHWIDGERTLDLNIAGLKRRPCSDQKRARMLVMTYPAPLPYGETFSAMSRPDWLDDEFGEMSEIDRDTIEVIMTR